MWDEFSLTWTCKHCGAIYDVQVKQSVLKAKPAQPCDDCGKTMRWHESISPRDHGRFKAPVESKPRRLQRAAHS